MTAEPVSAAFAAVAAFSAITLRLQSVHLADGTPFVSLRGLEAHCRPPPLTILHCRFLN